MKFIEDFIVDLVLEFFEDKSEVERLFLTNYITHKANTLLSTNLITKKDLKLADTLAFTVYAREARFLNQVTNITNNEIEKEIIYS